MQRQCDENGAPRKGSKAAWTDKMQKRYSNQACQCMPVVHLLPSGWSPEVVIMDSMFLIQCNPLRQTMDYAKLILNRFALQHYQAGVREVHLVFDAPSNDYFNPKMYEQSRRDSTCESFHEHVHFEPCTKVPKSWRTCIECRQCKRSIIEAIGLSYIQIARFIIGHDKQLVLAGCFSGKDNNIPIVISGSEALPTPNPIYKSCSMEADMRIWRHVAVVNAHRILVYSPDTDVYNIGTAVAHKFPEKDVIIQVNVAHSRDLRYVQIKNIPKVLENDPDVASLPPGDAVAIFYMLFVVSGCDYISYFNGFGKGTFLNIFYQYAEFVTGKNSSGLLCHYSEDNKAVGFLAFLRLIGSLYFKKHYSAVVSLKSVETSQQLLNSFPSHAEVDQHKAWFNASIVSIVV